MRGLRRGLSARGVLAGDSPYPFRSFRLPVVRADFHRGLGDLPGHLRCSCQAPLGSKRGRTACHSWKSIGDRGGRIVLAFPRRTLLIIQCLLAGDGYRPNCLPGILWNLHPHRSGKRRPIDHIQHPAGG